MPVDASSKYAKLVTRDISTLEIISESGEAQYSGLELFLVLNYPQVTIQNRKTMWELREI